MSIDVEEPSCLGPMDRPEDIKASTRVKIAEETRAEDLEPPKQAGTVDQPIEIASGSSEGDVPRRDMNTAMLERPKRDTAGTSYVGRTQLGRNAKCQVKYSKEEVERPT